MSRKTPRIGFPKPKESVLYFERRRPPGFPVPAPAPPPARIMVSVRPGPVKPPTPPKTPLLKKTSKLAIAAAAGAGRAALVGVRGAANILVPVAAAGVRGAGKVAAAGVRGAGKVAAAGARGAGKVAAAGARGAGKVAAAGARGAGKVAAAGARGAVIAANVIGPVAAAGARAAAAGAKNVIMPAAGAGILKAASVTRRAVRKATDAVRPLKPFYNEPTSNNRYEGHDMSIRSRGRSAMNRSLSPPSRSGPLQRNPLFMPHPVQMPVHMPAAPAPVPSPPRTPSTKVGEGSNGCFYRPRMRCERTTAVGRTAEDQARAKEAAGTKLASKLCDYNTCLTERAEVTKPILMQSDPNQTFHIGTPIICEPDAQSRAHFSTQGNTCAPVTQPESARILIYTDGGLNLHQYVTDPHLSQIVLKQRVKTSIVAFQNLFNGLSIMNHQHFYHNDIKPLNITVGDLNNPSFKFIDFGMAFTMPLNANLPVGWTNSETDLYSFKYAYWPLDAHILLPRVQYVVAANTGDQYPFMLADMELYVTNWITYIFDNYPSVAYFYLNGAANGQIYQNRDSLISDLVTQLTTMYENRRHGSVAYRNWNIISKIDTYSLGISLIETIRSLLYTQQSLLRDRILNFIVGSRILNVDPNMRPSARDFAPMYRNFVNNLTSAGLLQ